MCLLRTQCTSGCFFDGAKDAGCQQHWRSKAFAGRFVSRGRNGWPKDERSGFSKCVLTRFSAGHKSDSNLVDRAWRHPRFRNGWTRSGEKTTKNTWEGSDMLCRWENFGSLSASKCRVSWWGIQTPNAAWSLLSDNRVEAGAARHTSTPYILYFRAPDSKPSYHNLS